MKISSGDSTDARSLPSRDKSKELPVEYHSQRLILLEQLSKRRKRSPLLHWTTFVLTLFSLGIAVAYVANAYVQVTPVWIIIDISINAFFIIEFFTRSGFSWNPLRYSLYRIFELAAIVPFLALIGYGIPLAEAWVWVILAARVIRAVDRLLGDGFFQRNALALVEGFEEEITDQYRG
jgi:hypothetical protein